jgi:ABC-type multidrug transport system fused ATPase/permease subunit
MCLLALTLSPDWPARGEIQLNAVSLKYNMNQDPVVKNVSLHIKPGQKVKLYIYLELWL